jgi:hypothetical protein
MRIGAAHWPPLLQQATTDLLLFNQMLEDILKFSLVERVVDTHMLRIHRLVQAVQVDRMEREEQRYWAECVVRAVNEAFPRHSKERLASWSQCLRYLEQVQACDMLLGTICWRSPKLRMFSIGLVLPYAITPRML